MCTFRAATSMPSVFGATEKGGARIRTPATRMLLPPSKMHQKAGFVIPPEKTEVFFQARPQLAIHADTDGDVIAIHQRDKVVQRLLVVVLAKQHMGMHVDSGIGRAADFCAWDDQLRNRPKVP